MQKAWGAHTMHGIQKCCKYGKDGTPKKDFSRRRPRAKSHGSKPSHGSGSAYAQLLLRSISSRSPIGNSSACRRNVSTFMKVIAKTLTLPEELGMVVLGNLC